MTRRCLRRAARAGGLAFGSVLIAYSVVGCAIGGAVVGAGLALSWWRAFPVRRREKEP